MEGATSRRQHGGTAAKLLNPVLHQRAIGKAALGVKADGSETRIDVLYQQGCAKLRLPHRSADGHQEAVFINSSGGLTGGDVVALTLDVGMGASLSLTTQACERAYRSSSGTATVTQHAAVSDGGQLFWLPQETILFDGASVERRLDVDLAQGAELLLVEPLIFGRGASGEAVCNLHLRDIRQVRRGGRLIHTEAAAFDDRTALDARFGLNGNCAMASLLLVSPRAESLVEDLRKIIGAQGAVAHWAKGPLAGKLTARIVAKDGYHLRQICIPAIAHLAGRGVPKIWTS